MRCRICRWPGETTGSARMSAPITRRRWPRVTSTIAKPPSTAAPTKSSAISSRRWFSDSERQDLSPRRTRRTRRKTIDRTGAGENCVASAVLRALRALRGSVFTDMDFSLSEEQTMLKDSVNRFLGENFSFEQRRKMLADRQPMSVQLWQGLAELGVLGVPFAPEDGGIGGGGVETMLVMEAFGRNLTRAPYRGTVVLAGG